MALQGHSPPFAPAGSPPRLINGPADHHFPHSVYNPHRPMLPPSPRQYPQFHHPQPMNAGSLYDHGPGLEQPPHHSHHNHHQSLPPPLPPTSNMLNGASNGPIHKRPGSSMSISSMLDSGNDPQVHHHQPASRPGLPVLPPALNGHNTMSPPSQLAGGPPPFDYPWKRSQTPDRLEYGFLGGNRQRSASGTSMPFDRAPYGRERERYSNPAPSAPQFPPFGQAYSRDDTDGARRTSISSILQRPNSQPQSLGGPPPPSLRPFDPAPPPTASRNNWYADPPQPTSEPPRTNGNINGSGSSYDTKPPGFRYMPKTSPAQSLSALSAPQSRSPELRRVTMYSSAPHKSGLAGILNGPTSQPSDPFTSHSMRRQDSTQSIGERSNGDGSGRFRHFSPFALRPEDRKNSDEATHKAIIGLGLEQRRRYSPVPQAVQGPQAQTPTPVPDKDHRVFSGLGGGLSTTPQPSSSPFKQNAEVVKMNRTASNTGKRARKNDDVESTEPKKRKYQNSYKADLEELSRASVGPASTRKYDSPPIFRSKKTVKLSTITSQTLRKPRRHLGTFRYDADILDDTENETLLIKPRLIPTFSPDDINCTYTFHVSKAWLHTRELRLITSSRNLWGTGIYSDDTDPLVAAMHMGFLKPKFSAIDESLLSRIVHDQNPRVDITKDLRPPNKPIDLAKPRDLKITCIVMPTLDNYEATARYGINSREWPQGGSSHDGLSFSILRVEVVDIGPLEKKMGRTGKSKKEWMRAQLLQRQRALAALKK